MSKKTKAELIKIIDALVEEHSSLVKSDYPESFYNHMMKTVQDLRIRAYNLIGEKTE